MKNIFFTSDTHFFHSNVIKYSNRPFKNVLEMNDFLIKSWNQTVKKNDDVYHLGDFALCKKKDLKSIVSKLNGNIHVVKGNHDREIIKGSNKDLFIWVKDYYRLKVPDNRAPGGKQIIILFHYPIESWDQQRYGVWHLHGHSHGYTPRNLSLKRIDVGVDVWNFKPVSYQEIWNEFESKPIKK